MNKPKIIALGGPTASGKSNLSIEYAKKFNGEIVNCDSRQFYIGMDIGTGKEKISEKNSDGSVIINGITHHLIDFLKPDQEYNLYKFQLDTFKIIDQILEHGKLPILVGGTGMYIDAVIYNYCLSENTNDDSRRKQLSEMSVQQLQKMLGSELDKLNESDRMNPHRLIRAIERKESNTPTPTKNSRKYNVLYLCTNPEKKELEKNIDTRVNQMFKDGLEDENRQLRNQGYTADLNSMKSIGYQEFDKFFEGTQTLEETKELIKTHTRQYAKRQMTWFRRNKDIIYINDKQEFIDLISQFLIS